MKMKMILSFRFFLSKTIGFFFGCISMRHKLYKLLCIAFFLTFSITAKAQDLDPRAYARLPVNMSFIVVGFGYTYGNVIIDPSLPLQDLDAKMESPMVGVGHTFNFLGFTSQAFAALPYAWAQASGNVLGTEESQHRSGLGDMRLRLSVLLLGARPVTLEEFEKKSPKFVLGTSLMVYAPTGQYFPDKVINIGTNRWSFKPEIGISYPVTEQWFIDLYAGIWFFTNNYSFYPGNSVRKQNPLGAFQSHISYNFNPTTWAAVDFSYYTGGQSSVNGNYDDDDQNNVRIGATVNLPLSQRDAIKIAYSTGAIIRFGADFSSISVAWQTAFF
jgi:hypothetical protein